MRLRPVRESLFRIGYVLLGLGLGLGCGKSSTADPVDARTDVVDAVASSDASVVGDAAPNDAGASLGVGQVCSAQSCPSPLSCFTTGYFPASGYCTTECTDDLDCGMDSFCSNPLDQGTGSPVRLCLARCTAASCTGTNRVCNAALASFVGGEACLPGKSTANDGDQCADYYECGQHSVCIDDDPFDFLGGYCSRWDCTVGQNNTCNSGICVKPGGDAFCVAGCTMSSECRTVEGYDCVDLFATGEKLCIVPHKDAGDGCDGSTDPCADMSLATPWTCLTGTGFPGGYCSASCSVADPATCPELSHCYDPDSQTANDEYCVADCDMTSDCRDGEGYVCSNDEPGNLASPKGCRQGI